MIRSTFSLALGVTFIAVFRVSGNPLGAGVLAFLGAWFVAIGCALHLAAVIDRLALAIGWRISMKLAAWVLILGATAWAIAHTPGPELTFGLLTVPVVVAVAGIMLGGRDRWPALGFAAVALALSALLVPPALRLLGMG